jgi:spore germination protein YaaH
VFRKILVITIGIILGIFLILLMRNVYPQLDKTSSAQTTPQKKEVIGFLLYALLQNSKPSYANEITTLSYFGLTLDSDGTILKMNNPQEAEPGWNALSSGRVDPFLQNAKQNHITPSLVIYNGDNDVIDQLMIDPITHANKLMSEVLPIMNQHGFTNVNLDIEATKEASPEAQMHFVQFVQTVKNALANNQGKTLSVDVSTLDVINNHDLINPKKIAKIADSIVIMAYDYHSTTSSVTGPVAPLDGAGIQSEYDVKAALAKALAVIPRQKIILGAPLYGYGWETIGTMPRSAVIPNSGVVASNKRAERLVSNCATCSAQYDMTAQEQYVIYRDTDTGAYRQLFYPTKQSMQSKVDLANTYNLGGLALWALGYEGDTIMDPLKAYLQ